MENWDNLILLNSLGGKKDPKDIQHFHEIRCAEIELLFALIFNNF